MFFHTPAKAHSSRRFARSVPDNSGNALLFGLRGVEAATN
jgi:hypothetical protein